MFIIIGLFLIGIILGYLLRNKEKIVKFIEPITNWTIYLLLFVLGVAVGRNKQIISQFDDIGIEAGFITLFSILGSVVLAYLLYILLFKKHEE